MAVLPVLFGAVKTGLSTLMQGATIICGIAPYAVEAIKKFYPSNTALLEAVENVQRGCQVMRLAIIEQREVDRAASKPNVAPIPVPEPPAPEPEPAP